MHPISEPITGSESSDSGVHPYAALVEFYRAFNGRDAALMRANWLRSDEASMSNPLGGIRRGWDAIQQVYDRILSGPAEVYVEFYDYTIHHAGVLFCAVGRERGFVRIEGQQIDLAIRTSRVYRMDCGKWHQIHHHGSIDAPQLLANYQLAVLGGA